MTTFLTRTLACVALFFALLSGVCEAQSALGPNSLGFAYAKDYSTYTLYSTNDTAAGAATMIVRADGFATTPGGRVFLPLAVNAPLTFDTGATAETVTPSAVTCTQNSLPGTCTVTATFTYAHRAMTSIRTGTAGVCEAKNDILNIASGGTVVIANGTPAVTLTSTTTVGVCGASTVALLDTRAGAFQFYVYNGSTAYAASTSPFNSQAAASADLTTAVGSPFFYSGAASNATNNQLVVSANGANTSGVKVSGTKSRGLTTDNSADVTIVTGDDLLSISAFGADGTDFINTAGILFDSTGTIAATRVPSVIKFFTGTDAAPTVKTLALTINADQSATLVGQLNLPTLNNTSAALALKTTTSGNITLTPATAATAAVNIVAARLGTAKGADIASGGGSCVSGDCTLGGDGNVFLISGTTTVDGFATAGWTSGSVVWIQTSGAVTFNSAGTVAGGFAAMALTGNLSMTANDTIGLLYDGTSWVEIALIQR